MIKYCIKIYALCLCALLSQQAAAQQTITFDSEDRNSSYSGRKKKAEKEVRKNSLTVGLVSAINGYTPFYYERALLDFLSIQVGAGITYRSFGNDLGQMLWNDGKNSEFVENSQSGFRNVTDQYFHYKYRKASMGTYFSVAPKIYFSNDAMDGFYLAPVLEWKLYRYKAQLANETKTTADAGNSFDTWTLENDDRNIPHTGNTMDEKMSCLDISLNVGGHYQRASRLTIGWSIGLGLRKMKSERLDIYTISDGSNDYFRNTLRSYDMMKPVITANLIIGGCF